MPTRILIRNIEPSSKIAGAVVEEITVKQTGGGPAQSATLEPGSELEVQVAQGQKVTISSGEDDSDE